MFVLKTDFRLFVKVILEIPKMENLKRSFWNHITAQMGWITA